MNVTRWEDDATVWRGPSYEEQALRYHPSVATGFVSGRIITCVDVVDWHGNGGRDLLLSSWDPCYDGRVYLRQQIGTDGNGAPVLGPERRIEGVTGYVTAFRDGELFHLISASRMRSELYLYTNTGEPGRPLFGRPKRLQLDADWVRGNEYLHLARLLDIDDDGELELVVGTDWWDDYWPGGLEWNEHGYTPYDQEGNWLGGPLRAFLYTFKLGGSPADPVLSKGRPVLVDGAPMEVYGQLAPAFGDLYGEGRADLVCGDFLNLLHTARALGDGRYEGRDHVLAEDGRPLELDHCIHLPCIVDWNGDGTPDILVGAEDGYVTYLKNTGKRAGAAPAFENLGRLETTAPVVHASVLPSPAAFDFNGNGLPDLVVGNCSGELLFYPNMGPAERPVLGRESRLTAGGVEVLVSAGPGGSIQGPAEKMFGYTCPTIADWNGNGLPDVLMSDVRGRHLFFENDGGSYPPAFRAAQALRYQGEALKTVWRVRPSVVDWLGSGDLHYLALDEDGCLADYRRHGDTTLGDKRLLTWDNGETVRFTVDEGGGRGRVKLCLCDWRGSGVYDLIVGTHARASLPPGPSGQPRNSTGQAGVFLLRNVGGNHAPAFARPEPIRFKGETIAMGMHACSPEAVDWTGCGELGLIVGVEDGSMVWLPRADLTWGADP